MNESEFGKADSRIFGKKVTQKVPGNNVSLIFLGLGKRAEHGEAISGPDFGRNFE